MSVQFNADMSNSSSSDLFPRVTGQKVKAIFTMETAVGTITQTDSRAFSRAFNSQCPYPTNSQVCLKSFPLLDDRFSDRLQITDRMQKGKVQMGTNAQTLQHWDQDLLNDCSPEDQLHWGQRGSYLVGTLRVFWEFLSNLPSHCLGGKC